MKELLARLLAATGVRRSLAEEDIKRVIRQAYARHLDRRAMSHEVQLYADIVSSGQRSLRYILKVIATSPEAAAVKARGARTYADWIARYDTLTGADRAAIAAHIATFPLRPRISINLAAGGIEADHLEATVRSIRNQLYPDWQLCIASAASLPEHIAGVLAKARDSDPRITWLSDPGITTVVQARERAREISTGDYLAVVHEGDLLAPTALYEVANVLRAGDVDIVYSDHDYISDADERATPVFKSDWNLELLRSWNYVGDLMVYRRDLAARAGAYRGGARDEAEHDLTARLATLTTDARIRHVPAILYHRRVNGHPVHGVDREAGAPPPMVQAALQQLHSSRGRDAEAMGAAPQPLVSILIPTRDRRDLLQPCLDGLLTRTAYRNFEVLVIDHETSEPAAVDYLRKVQSDERVRLMPYRGAFNYADMNNKAVEAARGDIVVLLNNDTEVIDPGWLDELVALARAEGIGAVGALLLYPSGRVQHAGVVIGLGGVAGHIYANAASASGYCGRLRYPTVVSAVTGACLAVRKSIFREVGGLDSRALAVAYNDVDLCLKIRAAGYRNVWTPRAVLYHHESPSRGSDAHPDNLARWQREEAHMRAKWAAALQADPYYNVNLSLETPGCELAFPPRRQKPWAPA